MVEHAAESFFRVVWRARDFAVEGVHLSGEETFVSTGADPLHYRGTDGHYRDPQRVVNFIPIVSTMAHAPFPESHHGLGRPAERFTG